MSSIVQAVESRYKKKHLVDVKSGDTVRVHQRIKEGAKERVQVFEGLVIEEKRSQSLSATIKVRRIASGIGVEKTFLLHSPSIEKIEVVKRSKVRRQKLSYMRKRSGKSARLAARDFDRDAVNFVPDVEEKQTEPEIAEVPAEEPQSEAAETVAEKPVEKEEKADS